MNRSEEQIRALIAAQATEWFVIVFGAEISGAHIHDLVAFGSRLPGAVRYMALGDYANSRGATDMGLLPDRFPGYARVDDHNSRETLEKLWGTPLPAKPGFLAPQMLDAAHQNRLKALYVVGANPLQHFLKRGPSRGHLDLLVVHELFLTETAQLADVVLPALCSYEKDGTFTNTSGEVQLVRKAGETMGPRADFDLLRILSHQLEKLGLGKAFHYRTPEAVFDEIRRAVPGYDVSQPGLLAGGAEPARVQLAPNGHAPYDVPVGLIFSANDTLFSSGTLTRYCAMIDSLPESEARP